ncbi:MAG: FAD-dependent oxidoreductase [Bacteroidetes bacterium]|nr:FAD-dependent oxidoreductase [Bacteroidota bacterium]
MLRDGAKTSMWQDTVPVYTPTNAWQKDTIYDVLIVGGGITGLTTALLLQSEGKRCILAEAVNIGFGTSGGTTAHLNTFFDSPYPEVEKKFGREGAQLLARAGKEAIDIIEGHVSKYNIDCGFSYKQGYVFAEDEKQLKELEDLYQASQRAGVNVAYADDIHVPLPFTKALKFGFQAQFHPLAYLHGLARAFEEIGGVILQDCRVNNIEQSQQLVADTTLGRIRANYAVYATHIPPGLNILHLRNAPYRSYAMAFSTTDNNYPDALIYDMQDPYHYIRTQTVNDTKYLIVGGCDHKTGHEKNTEYVFSELEAYCKNYFKVGDVAWRWSSQYYVPADGLPYIGRLPGHDNIFTATGYNGNGMIFGTIAGKIICQLITQAEGIYEHLFNPNRIKPIAGFENFVKENADVVSLFISQRLKHNEITELVELAPGDAIVAKWDGHKVALYKDERGHVYAVDPVCPHAKCIVTWNSGEKSWDCPCHGGRYAPNGALLTGPATKGLTQIKWEDIQGD